MAEKIKIAIAGYGNIGRGVEKGVRQNSDMKLCAVVTRRQPESVAIQTAGVPVIHLNDVAQIQDQIDVMILCGGSATDLPEMGPQLSRQFHTVDSFDTHANIPQYYSAMDEASRAGGKISVISVGWDPGMFSLARVYAGAILPNGQSYTFWGRGVSQGHSDALRRVPGVKNGIQYTVPVEDAVEQARSGKNPTLSTRQKHTRECFVVLKDGADPAAVEHAIQTMPNYFADYDTTVHFISEDELRANHSSMPHGGFVIHSGHTDDAHSHVIEYSLKLDSNPEFTANILACYARAAYRLAQKGETGARSVLDIAPALLSPLTEEQLRAQLL